MREKLFATLVAMLLVSTSVAGAVAAQSNDVTWEGEVEVDGTPATDGSQYSYDVNSLDAVDGFTVNLTGSTAKQWSNSSSSGLAGGDSLAVSTAGTTDPIGPASGEPRLTVTAHQSTAGPVLSSFNELNTGETITKTITPAAGTYNSFSFEVGNMGDTNATLDVVIDGTTVYSGNPDYQSVTEVSINEKKYSGSESVNVDFVHTSGTGYMDIKGGNWKGTSDLSATISADDGSSKSFSSLSDGETRTVGMNLSTSATSVSLDSQAAGQYDLSVELQQVAETVDPLVEINGNSAAYSGTLAEGQTTSLNVDPAWIQEGTNRVNVSVGNGGGGPTPEVGLDYDHRAADSVSVQYQGQTWTERYNVSRTFAEQRSNTSLSIPFSSDRVVAVRDAEYRVNGGSWSPIPEADRSFDGSTLVLEVGDVSAGDSVGVRANGSKVRVHNGNIDVLQPTTEGDDLQTEIELSSWASDSYIDVTGTSSDDHLHYAENESWATPSEYARITSSGGQEVHLPGASSGATARIATLPLDVGTTGDVGVEVEKSGFNPEFRVHPGEAAGDEVTFSWEHPDLTTGTQYNLISLSDDKLLASDTAESPVFFEFEDSEQTVRIEEENTTSSSTGGGTGMWGSAESAVRDYAPVIPGEIVLFAGLFLFVGGIAWSERRAPNRAIYRRPMFWVGSAASALVAVIFLAPSAIVGPLQTALQATLPLAGIGAVGLAGLAVYGWYQRQQNESEPPTIQIMGKNDD
jgi:hypothetical protein